MSESTTTRTISDEAVSAKTGRNWKGWFALLDRAGAARLDHPAIVALLSKRYGVGPWWRQMVTVEYERARGLRARHQQSAGYAVNVSKTLAMSLPKLYAATTEPSQRARWFPGGRLAPTSKTKGKYFRGRWNNSSRIAINFYERGPGKAQLAVEISRLAAPSDVDAQRAAWKAALQRLQTLCAAAPGSTRR